MSNDPDFESYQCPTEYITENQNDTQTKNYIEIDIKASLMRARSHMYQDHRDNYVDTTYYDEDDEALDLGYQRLRKLHYYPEFSYLKKIFLDHNNLTNLPNAKYLPNLEQLTCSSNRLIDIPFYPNLSFLNISNNMIKSCKHYHNSNIQYFDCSYNPGFVLDCYLPICKHLYINDNEMRSIDLDLLPRLQYLDCGNNKLSEIHGGTNLIEINMQYNRIRDIPDWPNLVRLMADYNEIEILYTYPKMISANITHNKLFEIKEQPSLKKLIANNNNLDTLGNMPELELADLSHNNISKYNMPYCVEYISLQFNPISTLSINHEVFKSLKELQVNFETYKNIYEKYYNYFDSVNVQTNEEKLEQLLKRLDKVFDDHTARYVFRQFNNIKFKDRDTALFKITLKLYYSFFSLRGINTMEELVNTHEFKYLLNNITKFYYKTIVITLYFNGYHN
ncbi:putative leucine-rich repeat protein [Tupanvirus deep ocean]|uniref:Leucine-rich repeat protein n=2 Tax=Tupanvirus TaxID=2094720 RepID=A0AC62A8B8_9VIRU|nr:putative leucine-rich repeat protein [Tupanvirus deep ocean]QKU33964.1 putative leucine-rich repeat protein [Tupanvirus deep ocean]